MADFVNAALSQKHPSGQPVPELSMGIAGASIIGGDIYLATNMQEQVPLMGGITVRSSGGKFDLADPNSGYFNMSNILSTIRK